MAPIFKECGLIEQWGTGFKKIIKEMEQYPELELKINEPGLSLQIQFIKKYPSSTPQDALKQTPSWKNLLYGKKIIGFCKEPRTRDEIQDYINVKDRKYFREKILKPLIDQGYIEMTIPEKPNSPKQKYVTVKEGPKNE